MTEWSMVKQRICRLTIAESVLRNLSVAEVEIFTS